MSTAPMRDEDREDLHDHGQRLAHLEEMVGELQMVQGQHTETLETINGKLDTILHHLDVAEIGS